MKRNLVYIALILGITISCSKGGDDGGTPPAPKENIVPTVPVQLYPLNNTLCINNNVSFEWKASTDADGDALSYVVEVSESSSFTSLAFTAVSYSTAKLISLTKGKSYYWRIKAKDTKNGESAYSSVSQFLTEGEGVSNHLPFAPELVAPQLHAEIDGTSTTLSWTASDVDNDDLTFDVYLDTNASPTTKVSENQSSTTFAATGLTASTRYYFKVVVKDDKGGATVGQVWSFSTK